MAKINPNIYTVQYKDFHTGEIVKIKRTIPAKQHELLPKDQVKLTHSKNEDWKEGDQVTVSQLANRNPNVVQIEDKKGDKTFLYYNHLKMIKKGPAHGNALDDVQQSGYMQWP